MESAHTFLSGTLTALAFVIGLCFARYYVLTRDRFFIFFTITFWMLGVGAAVRMMLFEEGNEAVFYLPRLAAFLVLLAGIFDKNRRSARAHANQKSGRLAS